MSRLSIKYSELSDAASNARKVSNKLSSYATHAQSFLIAADNARGSDTYGYLSSTAALVRQKMNKATAESDAYFQLADKLDNLNTHAKETDQAQCSQINLTVTNYVGERSFFEKLKDAVYDGYVNFLDRLEGTGPLGQLLANSVRRVETWTENAVLTAKERFQHGAGKYFWDMAVTVAGVVGAIAGAFVAAAAAAAAAPALAVIATIGAIASVAVLVLKGGDAIVSVYNDVKAIVNQKDRNYTAARYYGNVDSFKDMTERYDMGDAKQNKAWETAGLVYDVTETTAGVVSTACTLATSIGTAGLTRDSDSGRQMVDWGKGLKQYVTDKFHKAGGTAFGTDWKKALKPNMKKWTGNYGSKLAAYNFSKTTLGIFTGAKVISTLDKTIGNFTTWGDAISGESDVSLSTAYDLFKAGTDTFSNVTFFNELTGDVMDGVDSLKKIISSANDVVSFENTAVGAGSW